ncbi:acyl-CoA N-acyltransferase [Aspergillus avenaceus]|uniref:N-alpha-acetyltransferase 40 n=1 Tax=Aspergillus avenaceus TaxID=36643 RepID=A0A5N6U249_ASPAV|nr:acyl-CoA N-acyltransferase [Aspergillus avenaceus]
MSSYKTTKRKSQVRKRATRPSSTLRRVSQKQLEAYLDPTPASMPLVEQTNALSQDEFIAQYVRDSDLSYDFPAKEETGHYKAEVYTASMISETDFEACFRLIELTSKDAYVASSGGWSPAKKRREMRLPDMKYLVVRARGSEDVVGFSSFMVTYEDGREVLYVYEIHLGPEVQGRGLGGFLVGVMDGIGERVRLEKMMLTCFRSNVQAMGFYGHIGFTVDEYSPQPHRLRNGTVKEPDYSILSRPLRGRA